MNLLLLLALSAFAAEPPFHLRQMDDARDVGAVNENFRAVSDAVKQADLRQGGDVAGTLVVDTLCFDEAKTDCQTSAGGSFTVGFDSSTQIGALTFPGSGATANNVCLARSTLTVTGHGCPVQVIFNGPISECNSSQLVKGNFLLNGAFVSGSSAGADFFNAQCNGTGATETVAFNIKIPAPSAGTLNFCAIAYSSVGNFESSNTKPQFRIVELCNISN